MIEVTLRNHLLSDPDVKLLLGDRIYPLAAPENATYPLMVYRRSGTNREYMMTGSCGEARATFDLAILAEPQAGVDQYYAMKRAADAVRMALDGFTQRRPEAPATGKTQVKLVQITAESDDVFAPAHDEGQDSMGVAMTLDVMFSEPVRAFM